LISGIFVSSFIFSFAESIFSKASLPDGVKEFLACFISVTSIIFSASFFTFSSSFISASIFFGSATA